MLDRVASNVTATEHIFVLLSYESLNDTRFSDNRFCTWPAGIALPSGGDAY